MNFIENWAASAWRLWSVRLAAFAGIVAGVLAANPALVLGLIGFMPSGPWRYVASAGVGLVVFIIPTITRLTSQEKTDGRA